MAVAAFEGLQHCGNGERQKKQPNENGDLRRFLESFQEILSTRMYHIEISINGSHRQEGNAGSSVQKQHEEHSFAYCVICTPPLPLDEVVCLYGQTEEQENVRQHKVEKKDVVGVGFPEFQLEYEEMEDRCIKRQSQENDHDHDSCIEFVQSLVCGFTVLNFLKSGVNHFCVLFKTIKEVASHSKPPPQTKKQQQQKNTLDKLLQCPLL